jgi:Flp pilus assembly protein TadG
VSIKPTKFRRHIAFLRASEWNLIFSGHGVLADTRGIAAVEFAIVAPVLVAMLICTIDLGLGVYRRMQVETASHAGAQYAAKSGSNFDATLVASAVTATTNYSQIAATPPPFKFCGCPSASGVANIDCSAKCTDGTTPGTYAQVSAQATYATLIPYPIIPNSFTFTSRALVRIQ